MPQERDVVLKEFWRDRDRFADLFNGAFFGGARVIDPCRLTESDTDVSGAIHTKDKDSVKYRRNRDVVKKLYMGTEFVVLGLESQTGVDYAMPLRSMGYDYLNYEQEYRAIRRRNKREKRGRGGEYVSRFLKTDRLHPVITMCLYYGEDAWDGPLSLRDMMTELPAEAGRYFGDYPLNLVQITKGEAYAFAHPDVSAVFDLSRRIRSGDYDGIRENYESRELDTEVAEAVKAITMMDVELVPGKEGGKTQMWKSVQEWKEKEHAAGYISGQKDGYTIGQKDGYASGQKNGERVGYAAAEKQMVLIMLKKNQTAEAIHELTDIPLEKIYEIQKEQQKL